MKTYNLTLTIILVVAIVFAVTCGLTQHMADALATIAVVAFGIALNKAVRSSQKTA